MATEAKLFIAADHAGFRLKQALIEHLSLLGYEVEDCGAFEQDSEDDYPDFVLPLAAKVAATPGAFGIVCGGSGQGEAMCANRVQGVRTAVFYGQMRVTDALDREGGFSEDGYDAVRLSRRHNNANVLSLGARFVSPLEADEAVRIFLSTEYTADERHVRRLGKY
ncbi:MAG TPA: RpiB/LacA/LacB family sugar-phosphate isomerase [Candidatus Paceibacterota bacterium]|jgi:ribose 5-phosphate isomerase B